MPEEPWVHDLHDHLCALEKVLTAKIDGFRSLMDERDRRYDERDKLNKTAVGTALSAAEKASDRTESLKASNRANLAVVVSFVGLLLLILTMVKGWH